MNFKSDTAISEPVDPSRFTETASMNGLSWDVNNGIFIPVRSEIDYTEEPFPSALVRKL